MKRCYLIAVLLVLFVAGARAQVYWQSDFGPWGGRVNDLFEDAGGTLYAATMLFAGTLDGGLVWNPYGSGLRSEEILDLVAGTDGHLYAGTVRGLARSTYPVLTAKYLTPDFRLEQNTPNPATDVAVFGWSIPHAGHVRMSLHDVLGRELAVLLDAPAEPGLHWQSVDTRALVPGTYFCVLRFEGQLRDRKFQVVR
ncbi:MAG: hypothetical protein KFF77_02465 [Bacteroidetes bacterium]|nr:hypothetical protein [Bacteroidota bacterium]